jgi:DNA-binding response OmpR family regulator
MKRGIDPDGPNGRTRRMKILVVEDNLDMAEICRLILQERKFEVHIAHSAIEGMRMLEEYRPDCVVLDLTLADSSFESLQALRNHPALESARVVVVSGRNDVAELAQTYAAHAFLHKPFDMDDLVALLEA